MLKLYAAPKLEPLSLEDMAEHLRADLTAQSSYVDALIKAAREAAENETKRAFITQTWDLTLDRFPCVSRENPRGGIVLPLPPLQSVTHVKYTDAAGVVQTVESSNYLVESSTDHAIIVPSFGQSWPSARDQVGAVTVRFVCGYGNAAAVPEPIKLWLRFAVQEAYEGVPMTEFIRLMLMDYRVINL